VYNFDEYSGSQIYDIKISQIIYSLEQGECNKIHTQHFFRLQPLHLREKSNTKQH
jgi:hypothetical protein